MKRSTNHHCVVLLGVAVLLTLSLVSCLPELDLPSCTSVDDCPAAAGWTHCRDGLCFKLDDGTSPPIAHEWPSLSAGDWIGFSDPTPAPMSWHSQDFKMGVQLAVGKVFDLEFSVDGGGMGAITLETMDSVSWDENSKPIIIDVPARSYPLPAGVFQLVVVAKSSGGGQEKRSTVALDFTPPVLTLDSPGVTHIIKHSALKVRGQLSDEESLPRHVIVSCKCAEQTKKVIPVDSGGYFDGIFNLPGAGEIIVEVVGVDWAGNRSEAGEAKVIYSRN
ncbi:MAG TPA: hypothetical protein EYN06_10640 [Myxococcales bacterium]|nr:hypothetical protein [Myxococcales bacterium]HIN86930.1 hypothetical protein [Myxococcales bacterium]